MLKIAKSQYVMAVVIRIRLLVKISAIYLFRSVQRVQS